MKDGYNSAAALLALVWVPAPYTYGVGATFAWSTAAGWALGFGMGMAIGSWCSPWWGPVGYWGWGYYGAPAWGWGGYGGAAAANVYGRWGNTATREREPLGQIHGRATSAPGIGERTTIL